jgi:bifunctional non-homologous end joining protein LigD
LPAAPCSAAAGRYRLDPRDQARRISLLAHRDDRNVRLLTRNGDDLADRFPLAAAAVDALPVRSCVIDGEAIVCYGNGMAVFDLIWGHGRNGKAILCAFDLLEVDGTDLRRSPIEERKHSLANLLFQERDGIVFNAQYDGHGAIVFKQAWALGREGIVSKGLGSPYRAGRSKHWIRIKNPDAPASSRLEEEDWS